VSGSGPTAPRPATSAQPATAPQPPAGDRTELAFLGVLVVLVAFVYLGVTVSLAAPGPWDAGIRDWLMTAFSGDAPRAVLDVLNAIGSLEGGSILTIALAGLLLGLRRPGAAAAIASTWLAECASSLAKELLQRPRPPGASVESLLNESWSYPSGHVVRAVVVVAVLVWLATRGRSWNSRTLMALVAGLVAGVLMGIARIASGAHWPTDVLGGLLLGTAYVLLFAIAAATIADRFTRRAPAGPHPPPPSPGPGSA